MSGGGGVQRRTIRTVPAFNGNNISHPNPLPPVSNLPSFSYGSPQTALPKPITVRDTRVTMNDALEKADTAARARLEAAAEERRLIEEQTNREKATVEPVHPRTGLSNSTPRRSARGKGEDVVSLNEGKRTLRSQSILSRASDDGGSDNDNGSRASESNFNEGDQTSIEIHRIIQNARGTAPQPVMLRSRSINIGMKEPTTTDVNKLPRSAMKGSRDETTKSPAKPKSLNRTLAQRNIGSDRLPVLTGERDATFDEENQAIGIASRAALTHSAAPDTLMHNIDRLNNDDIRTYRERPDTPPDTAENSDIPSYQPYTPADIQEPMAKSSFSSLISRMSSRSWLPKPSRANSIKASLAQIQRNLAIAGIFLNNMIGPFMKYLMLGFLVFALAIPLSSFLQGPFPSVYTPPNLAPATADEVTRRLMEVERHLGSLSEAQDKDTKKLDKFSKDDRDSKEKLEQEILAMKKALSGIASYSASFDQLTKSYKADQKAKDSAMSNFQQQLSSLDKSIKANDADFRTYKVDPQAVRKQLDTVQAKIENVKADLKKLQSAHEMNEKAIKSFQDKLPKQIAARINPDTGKVVIAPELWRHLQALLREDMKDYIPASPGTEGSATMYSWDDFLAKNAAKMRGYIGEIEDQRWRDAISDGVVISREHMVGAMRDELESVRTSLEKDNQKLYVQILSEAETMAKGAVSTAATSISSAAVSIASSIARQGRSTQGSTNKYGDALIQAALHQYSKTILQKPDYALRVRGTLINPHLTSSTFTPFDNSGLYGSLSSLWRNGPNEPVHAITESTNIGDCWSFPRSTGQISMLLAESIYPTEVTIDHIPRGISGDDTSAPRDVEFWVRIIDDVLREQIGRAASVAIGEVLDKPSTRNYRVNQFVRVASFTYDITSAYPVQTFEIPIDLEKLDAQVEEVSFRILDNWGNPDYTSIYRLRVHGSQKRSNNEETVVVEGIPGL